MRRTEEKQNGAMREGRKGIFGPTSSKKGPIEGGTPNLALRDIPLAGCFISLSLCLPVARITHPHFNRKRSATARLYAPARVPSLWTLSARSVSCLWPSLVSARNTSQWRELRVAREAIFATPTELGHCRKLAHLLERPHLATWAFLYCRPRSRSCRGKDRRRTESLHAANVIFEGRSRVTQCGGGSTPVRFRIALL